MVDDNPVRQSLKNPKDRRAKQAALATALFLPFLLGCVYPAGDARVFVSSDPLGAEIMVDGSPTGKTTPASLDLGGLFGSDHQIELRKKGFDPEKRKVSHYSKAGTAYWDDGTGDFVTPPIPLWWTIGDILFPFEVRWTYVPHNLHVKLFPKGTFHSGVAKESDG